MRELKASRAALIKDVKELQSRQKADLKAIDKNVAGILLEASERKGTEVRCTAEIKKKGQEIARVEKADLAVKAVESAKVRVTALESWREEIGRQQDPHLRSNREYWGVEVDKTKGRCFTKSTRKLKVRSPSPKPFSLSQI